MNTIGVTMKVFHEICSNRFVELEETYAELRFFSSMQKFGLSEI